MANFNNLALTVNGIKALLAAQAGTTLTLSKIGMGSGSATNSAILTDLVTPELMMPISEKTVNEDSNYVTISARMTNENITEGFYWRETGLFFEDSEGKDVLFAYASVSNDQYDYIPAYSDQRYIKHVRIANVITDSANVTIKETEGLIYVDTLTFEKHLENTNNPHKVTASQVGLGNVSNVTTNDQTPTYTVPEETSELVSGEKLSVAFGKIAKAIRDFISHLSNKSNPHEVTANQTGALSLSGGTLSNSLYLSNGNVYVGNADKSDASRFMLENAKHKISFELSTAGNMGIFDHTDDKWLLQIPADESRVHINEKITAPLIDIINNNWNGFSIINNDGKIRGGMQNDPSSNCLAFYHRHPDSDYSEKFTLTKSDILTSEVWYSIYSTKNIKCGTSDLTAGSSSLATNNIYLVYS